jgi:hypothetical protein
MTSTARIFAQRLNNTRTEPQPTVDNDADLAILRRLEQRAVVRGALPDEEPWGKKVLRTLREDREATARYEAEKAEREAAEAEAAKPLPQIVAEVLAGTGDSDGTQPAPGTESRHMPLNGPGVLLAALAGHGTINGAAK